MIIHGYPSYSIFYREMEECWLLGGLICTLQDPDMVQARLLIREVGEGGQRLGRESRLIRTENNTLSCAPPVTGRGRDYCRI